MFDDPCSTFHLNVHIHGDIWDTNKELHTASVDLHWWPACQYLCDQSNRSLMSSLSEFVLPSFLHRHPWTFIAVKGNTSSAVEDHAIYQGRISLLSLMFPGLHSLDTWQRCTDVCVDVCVDRDQSLLWGPECLCLPVELRGAFHHYHQQPVGAR